MASSIGHVNVTRKTTSSRIIVGCILLTCSLLLVLTAAGLWVSMTGLAQTLLHQGSHQSPAATSTDRAEVTAIGNKFMNALLQQRYDTMWSMLHPQVQAMWPNEATFAAYYKARFHDYKLQGFSTGQMSTLPSWTNPETVTQYNNVSALPVSLQIDSLLPPDQKNQLAPQFQQPGQLFRNLPIIMQRTGNKWLIVSGGPADTEAPILPPATTPEERDIQVPILMYHHVTNKPTKNLLDFSLTVTQTNFNKQLDYLKSHGYHSITLNQLINAFYYGTPLPTKPIIFTFDDGYDDAYQSAYPSLKAHGYSGMFYIITGKVGWQGQMTWGQMHEMLMNGMQMGSHTIHHVEMGAVYQLSSAQAQQEVQISQMDMEKNLGIPIQHFCYPNGSPFKTIAEAPLREPVTNLLAKTGYVDATTDPGRTGIIQSNQTPFALLRIRVDGRESMAGFMDSVPD